LMTDLRNRSTTHRRHRRGRQWQPERRRPEARWRQREPPTRGGLRPGGRPNASPGPVGAHEQWPVTSRGGLWKDSYSIEPNKRKARDPRFAVPSDSGAAVLDNTNGAVIGIVVGGANLVPGCRDSIVYVQDIDSICTDLRVDVLP